MFKKPTKTEIREMIRVATEARENAFAHRSKHKIGASVLTGSGEIFGGCNIESVISGLGTCAERCAIDHAIVHGHYNLRAVCTIDSGYTPSCGACLQYTLLFSQVADHEIYMINGDVEGNYEIEQLSKLIPEGYRTKNNLEAIRSYGKKELIKPKRTKRKKL